MVGGKFVKSLRKFLLFTYLFIFIVFMLLSIYLFIFFVFFNSLSLYLLGNVTSAISVIIVIS